MTLSFALFAVALSSVPAFADPPFENWCTTQEAWEAKQGGGDASPVGTCPPLGLCDDPATRDENIPNADTPVKMVRIIFNVLTEDDGSNPAASAATVLAQLEKMNADFEPYQIQFDATIRFVASSEFRNPAEDEIDAMKTAIATDVGTACNIFIANLQFPVCGFATFPWDPDALEAVGGVIVHELCFGPERTTMTHEMGHILGLWHTHHGVSEVEVCSACYERADGADGDTTGDLCSDTPATPKNFTCFPPTGTDPCSGLSWGPTMPENHMGFGPDSCRTEYSAQQAGRMHCWASTVLSGWIDSVGDETVTLEITPPSVPLDGSVATLVATVLDGDGTPLPDVFVTFDQIEPCPGAWTDAGGTPQLGPNDGPTDENGERTTFFLPASLGACEFAAVTEVGSATATLTGVEPDVDLELIVEPEATPCLNEVIIAASLAGSGEPLSFGRVHLTTTLGTFVEGDGAPGPSVCVDLSTGGIARVNVSVPATGIATITACFLADASAPCAATADCATFEVELCCDCIAMLTSDCRLTGVFGDELGSLDTGEQGVHVAALESGRGVVVWDAHTFEMIQTIPSGGAAWGSGLPADAPAFAYAHDAARIGLTSVTEIATIDLTTSGVTTFAFGSDWFPDSGGAAWRPDGERFAFARRRPGPVVTYRYDEFTAAATLASTLHDLAGFDNQTRDIAYADDGTRVAVAFVDFEPDPDAAFLVILDTDGVVIDEIALGTGVVPAGIDWSGDSQFVAVDDGTGGVQRFDRNGEFVDDYPLAVAGGGDLAYAPGGEWIASHLPGAGVAVHEVATGAEVARLEGLGGVATAMSSIAWRGDGKVLFATTPGSTEIHIFAPFDVEEPQIDVMDTGPLVVGPTYTLTGNVTDDTGLRPGGLEWSLDGAPPVATPLGPGGAFSITTPLTFGPHSLCLVARDIAGNTRERCVAIERTVSGKLVLQLGETRIMDGDAADFGPQPGDGAPALLTITARNVGGFPLDLACPTLAPPFGFVECPPATLAGDEQAEFTISADPTLACGNHQDVLQIMDDGPFQNPFAFLVRVQISCPGDADGDCAVGITDLLTVLASWGPCVDCAGDLNDDGDVGIVDLLLVLSGWGGC
ncbi:MAG: hypothetical protein HKN62_09675 [Phycisphaerales bacterium]|nr:hypothetical protein [Phycisphaerales bacterium]